MNENKLKEKFINLTKEFANPYSMNDDVSREINRIIDFGLQKIRNMTSDEQEKKIIESENNLRALIDEMKKSAQREHFFRKILEREDLENAEKKICPAWPCG